MSKPPSSRLVLVVEDDPSVGELVAKTLRAKSYEVRQAADGLSASRMLATFRRLPDLVICDVMMPGLDGFSLARLMKARAELRDIPIIFLTARTEPRDVVDGLNLGARHYIQKPFKLKDLMDKVERCFE